MTNKPITALEVAQLTGLSLDEVLLAQHELEQAGLATFDVDGTLKKVKVPQQIATDTIATAEGMKQTEETLLGAEIEVRFVFAINVLDAAAHALIDKHVDLPADFGTTEFPENTHQHVIAYFLALAARALTQDSIEEEEAA